MDIQRFQFWIIYKNLGLTLAQMPGAIINMAFFYTVRVWSQNNTAPRMLENSIVAFEMQACIFKYNLKYNLYLCIVFRKDSSIYP